MNEKEQTQLMKFIGDNTIYVNIGGIGYAYAITDLAKFVDDLMLKIKNDRKLNR